MQEHELLSTRSSVCVSFKTCFQIPLQYWTAVQTEQTMLTLLFSPCLPLTLPPPLCFPLSLSRSPIPPSPLPPRSVQTEGAGHSKGPQQHAKEVAAGLHWPAASHPASHLQGEQATVQGDAAHHLSAAGPRTHHRQQLLHERPPPEPGQMDRRRSQPRRPIFGVQHLYQSVMIDSKEGSDREGWGGVVEAWGGMEGLGLGTWVAVPSGQSEEENQTFYISFLFVCLFCFCQGWQTERGAAHCDDLFVA